MLSKTTLLLSLLLTTSAQAFTYVEVDRNGPAGAWGKAVGDLNGDNLGDLLVGGYLTVNPGLYWYRNPTWTKQTINSSVRISTDIEVADLNRDTRNDIVTITNNALIWFENTGSVWTTRTIATNKVLHDIEVKDLDKDGKLDIIGRNQKTTGNKLHFWRQISTTNWSYTTITLPEVGEGLLATDLDRDSKIDIVIGKYWFKNNSTPGVFKFDRFLYNADAPTSVYLAAGTIDTDAYVDIVASPAEPATCTDRVSWFKAPAATSGQWTEHVIEPGTQCVVHFVGVADFDRDGTDDVATAMMQQGTNPKIKVYYNIVGNGVFGAPTIIADTSSHSMKIVDINNDGKKSLFGADWNKKPKTIIKLWHNELSPSPCTE